MECLYLVQKFFFTFIVIYVWHQSRNMSKNIESKQIWVLIQPFYCWNKNQLWKGFIKSSNHQPTDSPTHQPNNHIQKTWKEPDVHSKERKHSWENVELYFGLSSTKNFGLLASIKNIQRSLLQLFFRSKL